MALSMLNRTNLNSRSKPCKNFQLPIAMLKNYKDIIQWNVFRETTERHTSSWPKWFWN